MKNYELFDHTADIGIRVRGADLKELFKNTALAMFDIITQKQNPEVPDGERIEVKQEAGNLEELFVNWLNELLSLSAVKDLIFSGCEINKLENNLLQATVIGGDIRNYKLNTEIKAATYHELKIEETQAGWQAEVIFDV